MQRQLLSLGLLFSVLVPQSVWAQAGIGPGQEVADLNDYINAHEDDRGLGADVAKAMQRLGRLEEEQKHVELATALWKRAKTWFAKHHFEKNGSPEAALAAEATRRLLAVQVSVAGDLQVRATPQQAPQAAIAERATELDGFLTTYIGKRASASADAVRQGGLFADLEAVRSYGALTETRASALTIATLEERAAGHLAQLPIPDGPTYREILRTYTALTGRPPLLPRWGFGVWVTSYPQEHQNQVLDFVRRHREKKIPLDAVILDYHWEEKFHNFQWRRGLIPDPAALVAGLRAENARLGLILTSYLNTRNRPLQKWLLNTFGQNVTPGMERDDERALDEFAEAKSKGYLAHENVRWWFGAGGLLDFTNPAASAWWQEKLRPLFEIGADFIKNDDGEDLPDDAQACNGMDGREYHNIYGFYYGRATYARPPVQAKGPAARTLIYARTAWIGSQRYPALFLGDQQADFEGIRRSMRAGLNLAMSGFSYWTADGFGLSGKTDPETHMRYAQWALLSPVARYFVRPAAIDETRFPWSHNAQVEANFRKMAELRLRLLPYYNTLAHESHRSGMPIMRPLLLEFPGDARLRSVDDQIMLGSQLMICPVVERGATSRKITLPEGVWHDFWSERCWEGGSVIEYPAALDCLPLLVHGGSILPMGPVLQSIPDGHQFDQLEFHVWGPFPAQGQFIDDDGQSVAYQDGAFSRTTLRAEQAANRLRLRISGVQGKFVGQVNRRRVELILHQAGAVENAQINGENAAVSSAPDLFQISFEHSVLKDALIEILFSA